MAAKVFPREIADDIVRACRAFPSVVLTGPRRAGKTWCLRHAFPKADYHLLEDPDVLARAKADPRAFLDDVRTPAILDEIQNAPELLPFIRTRIDAASSRKGRWLLTGSQDFALMKGVSESMAGRSATFQMWPLSVRELGGWDLLKGGYPEVHLRPRAASTWFRSYVQTYLERDVRAVTAVQDLATFRRFLSLLAVRNGTLLNRSELAGPLGVSVPTISQWVSILETTGVVQLVPPYFENLGKRIVKSPKLYFVDTGLLCHLLGLEDRKAVERSPLIGNIFEAFVASEIVKQQIGEGRRREIFHFRDQQGLEVDFIVPVGRTTRLIEAKFSKTPTPQMAKPIQALLDRFDDAEGVVVHRGPSTSTALAPGVKAVPVEHFFT